jgi:aminoglycoside phosphotransferase (APT) family kinase protein
MLPGFTACYANLSEEAREALAQPIALFLSHLHATPQSIISDCQSHGDNQARIDWKQLIPKIMKNIEELALLNLLEKRSALKVFVEGLQDLRPPITSTIVHGDFYVRHLLVDERHNLAGVIDWGDIHCGDPAIDLAIAHSFLPECAHKKFREAYGEISTDTWSLALLRAIYSSTVLVLYGHHAKDPVILREGLRSLKILVNR